MSESVFDYKMVGSMDDCPPPADCFKTSLWSQIIFNLVFKYNPASQWQNKLQGCNRKWGKGEKVGRVTYKFKETLKIYLTSYMKSIWS